MKVCLYCKKDIKDMSYINKIGTFCSKEHYEKYYDSLSNEELVKVMNNMCVCSDE